MARLRSRLTELTRKLVQSRRVSEVKSQILLAVMVGMIIMVARFLGISLADVSQVLDTLAPPSQVESGYVQA